MHEPCKSRIHCLGIEPDDAPKRAVKISLDVDMNRQVLEIDLRIDPEHLAGKLVEFFIGNGVPCTNFGQHRMGSKFFLQYALYTMAIGD